MKLLVNLHRSPEEDVDRVTRSYDQLKSMLSQVRNFDRKVQLLNCLQQLHEFAVHVASFAHEFDVIPNRQGNGFRTWVEMGVRFFKSGIRTLKSGDLSDSFLQEYTDVASVYASGIPYLKMLEKAFRESGSLLVDQPELIAKLFHNYVNAEESVKKLFCKSGLSDFGPVGQQWVSALMWQRTITLAPNICSLIRCLFSSEYRKRMLFHFNRKTSVKSVSRTVQSTRTSRMMMHWYADYVNGWGNPPIIHDFEIERQKEFVIQLDEELMPHLVRNQSIRPDPKKKITCNLIRGREETKILMINMHGGGFTVGDRRTNEPYLRQWVTHVPGLAVISFEYSLLPDHKFPTQVQEALDVWLFFTDLKNKMKIRELLGSDTDPEKIVLSGDSAGGVLCMTTLICLQEIRSYTGVRLPDQLFLFYPLLLLHPVLLPSHLVSAVTPLFHPILFHSMYTEYVPSRSNVNNNEDDGKDVNANELLLKSRDGQGKNILDMPVVRHVVAALSYLFSVNTDLPEITDRSYQASESDLIETCRRMPRHPLTSPLLYDYSALKDMPLYVCCCTQDSLFDEAVLLGQKWSGPLVMDVMSSVQHGFLNGLAAQEPGLAAGHVCNRIKQLLINKARRV